MLGPMIVAPTSQLVGRAAELEVLDRAVAGLEDGYGGALSIVGAPGIGKSRLLAELGNRADTKGYLVLAGAASELERDLPFGVFVDAMDEYLESLEPRRLERLEEEVRVELARLFPSLASFGGGDGAALQDERYRVHRAVRILLETLATKPLILVLDDFHWTDSGSVELAGALLRRPPAARVLLVLGIRPRQLPQRLASELSHAERDGTLTRIELEPLSLEDARELLGEAVSSSLAEVLYEESGGVPFYLEQLARVPSRIRGAARGRASSEILRATDVPPMVVDALREELSLLSDSTRLVLQGAAVAGDPFEPELAAVAAECAEPTALDALDELLRLDFVRTTDVPRRFRFRHPLVRRAVYEAAPAGWRLAAHERSAEALAARGASAAARAHHLERSARHGSADAVAALSEAGAEAAGRAPGTAARWFEAALRLLPDSAPREQRVGLLLARAQGLAAVGQMHESYEALERSLDLTPDTEAAMRTRLTAACAGVERYLGHHEKANRRLTSALEAAPPESPEAVALLIELANDGLYRVDFEAMQLWADRAVAAAEASADPALPAAAHAMASLAGAWGGNVEKAETAATIATRLVDGLTDAQLATRLDAAANLASAQLSLAHFPDAARHAERTLALGRAIGQTQLATPQNGVLGSAWTMGGRLAEAADLLDGALEGARLLDEDQGLMWTQSMRSSTSLLLGDVDGALDAAQEAYELSAGMEEGLIAAWAGLPLARVLVQTGDHERAVELMLTCAGGEDLGRIPSGWRTMWLEVLTRARLELGEIDAARRSTERAAAWAAAVNLPFATAMADLARARIALADGNHAAAVELSLAAVAAAESAGARVDAAVARTLAGRALGEAGDRASAIEQLNRAGDELSRFGAVRYRQAVDHELRRLGEKVRHRSRGARPTGTGLGSLTDRELEIARLAADRLTNREIGGRLFLSEKTIETHMRNIFHKLGLSSRVEVARAIERADRQASRGS
jgi:DNA-binding NarL/FixJ family response regulator